MPFVYYCLYLPFTDLIPRMQIDHADRPPQDCLGSPHWGGLQLESTTPWTLSAR